MGNGYNEALLPEGRHLSRHDLDQASSDHPLIIIRTCGHIAVANSHALALANITAATPNPSGGVIVRDAGGEPTGVLQETAINLVTSLVPDTSAEEMATAIKATMQHQTPGVFWNPRGLMLGKHLPAARGQR